jgi:hypothetical protein
MNVGVMKDYKLRHKRFTLLSHTGLVVVLEHLKINTRLTIEKFPSVKGECEKNFLGVKSWNRP